MKLLVGLWVWHVRDVLEATSGGCHVVGRTGQAQQAGSPRAVVVIAHRLRGLQMRKFLPLLLDLCLDGL
jgi:hypothetical protein